MIGAPDGWNQDTLACGALAVTESVLYGMRLRKSFWKPSAQELATLNAGGYVTLSVLGDAHPVVAISAES